MACFRRCCCCVNLRVGGIMMGIMTLALSVFSLIPMSIFLVNRVFMSQVVTHLVEEYSVTGGDSQVANGGGGGSGLDSVAFWGTVNEALNNDRTNLPPEDDEKVVWLASVMYIFFIISLILLALFAVMSILLIYGAAKGKRWFMLPWIICTFGFLLAYLGGMCLSLWLIGLQVISVLLFFIALVEICIAFYLWLCVVSLFQILGSDEWGPHADDWEMKPRFSTKYNGVPTSEN